MRRRLYLMRHGAVSYFEAGRRVSPDGVALTIEGEQQAPAAAEALAGVQFDRVLTSGLRRTLETARIFAPAVEPDVWPELRELRGGGLDRIPGNELEAVFTGAFKGSLPEETRFLGGETIGELLDRVLPAIDRLVADQSWDTALAVLHGGVNRAILSYALTGHRAFLGGFEQAPCCVNVLDAGPDDWIVRTVNHAPYDPLHADSRATTMELLWDEFRRAVASEAGESPASG